MSFKISSLNLWAKPLLDTKLDIDVLSDHVSFSTTGNQELHFEQVVKVQDASGNLFSLQDKIVEMVDEISSLDASGTANVTRVEDLLEAYKTSNDAAVGQVQSDIATETGERIAAGVAAATARSADKVELQTLIATKEIASLGADAVIQSAVDDVSGALVDAIAAQDVARASDKTELEGKVDVEKARIDAILAGSNVNLDTFVEVVSAYEAADTSTLAAITALTSRVSDLESKLNFLTTSD